MNSLRNANERPACFERKPMDTYGQSDSNVKFLLLAGDLVSLSPTAQGLQVTPRHLCDATFL